jgi:hypothetical protein
MTLPWDRWQPEQEAPPAPVPEPAPVPAPEVTYEEPKVPYQAPTNLPEKRPEFNLGDLLVDSFVKAMTEVQSKPESKGTDLVKADAKNRSWRTFVQGMIVDIGFALMALVATLSGADPFVKETWILFGVLVVKTIITAAISYIMRLRKTPTIRTPGEKMAIMPIPRPMIDEERKSS